jgi:hypothetical protein
MNWILLAVEVVWTILVYRWIRSVGRQMEVIRDQIARLVSLDIENGKQLSDLWHTVQDLEATIADRDSRARTYAKKARTK